MPVVSMHRRSTVVDHRWPNARTVHETQEVHRPRSSADQRLHGLPASVVEAYNGGGTPPQPQHREERAGPPPPQPQHRVDRAGPAGYEPRGVHERHDDPHAALRLPAQLEHFIIETLGKELAPLLSRQLEPVVSEVSAAVEWREGISADLESFREQLAAGAEAADRMRGIVDAQAEQKNVLGPRLLKKIEEERSMLASALSEIRATLSASKSLAEKHSSDKRVLQHANPTPTPTPTPNPNPNP